MRDNRTHYDDVCNNYIGEITLDYYGRRIPKPSHGTIRIDHYTSSSNTIISKIIELYNKIVNKNLFVRRINISFDSLINEDSIKDKVTYEQYDLFTNYEEIEKKKRIEKNNELEENKLQNTIISIKNKYGKNAILKGMNYLKDGRTIERNNEIGGHKA